jgi:flagellar basal-body rod protein FlgG
VPSGIWTATSGAAAQATQVESTSNNLANVDTVGFKKDAPTFKEYLSTVEREPAAQDIPRGPIKDKEFYPLDGRDQSFVINDSTYSNFRQGGFRVTNGTLDIGLEGKGFLEVSTPSGIRYTRQGSLKLSKDGQLVTNDGYPVLAAQPGGLGSAPAVPPVQPGQGGPNSPQDATQGRVVAEQREAAEAAASRAISLRDRNGPVSIAPNGDVFVGAELVARLSVVEFSQPQKLRKSAGVFFQNPDPMNKIQNPASGPTNTVVRQGVVETSNVNPVEEMTNLIKANRLFEHDLKAMKTYGELLGREANDIGKL